MLCIFFYCVVFIFPITELLFSKPVEVPMLESKIKGWIMEQEIPRTTILGKKQADEAVVKASVC